MFSKLLKKGKLQKGFTIIEVMIVLAIAGLILVVVLIAIPQLQRNQRNEQRRSITARVVTEISSYTGNNNGDVPGSVADINGFRERYLGCDLTVSPVTCEINIEDPQTGNAMGMGYIDPTNSAIQSGLLAPTVFGQGALYYTTNHVCDGENLLTANGRNFALWTVLEGGALYCLDNK